MDRWVARATRFAAALLALMTAALALYWYGQHYIHPTTSVVDRDIETLESQIRAQPGNPELRVAMANLYVEKRRYDEAVGQAQQVLQANPDHLGALVAISQALVGNGDLDGATGHLAHTVDLNKDNPMAKASLQLAYVHQTLGGLYVRQGRGDEGIAEFRLALEIDRANADTLRLLGDALAAQGQRDEAIQTYRRSLRLVPDFLEVYQGLKLLYEQDGDAERVAFATGMIGYCSGEFGKALPLLQRAAAALPDVADVHLGLAMTYEKTGQRPQALEEYRKLASLDEGSIAARQGIGRLGGQP